MVDGSEEMGHWVVVVAVAGRCDLEEEIVGWH